MEKFRSNGEKPKDFIDKNFELQSNGKYYFKKGNNVAKMPRNGLNLKFITKAIRKREKNNPDKDTLGTHIVEELFKDNGFLAKIINKYIPDIVRNELTGVGGGPITYKEYFPALDPESKEEK